MPADSGKPTETMNEVKGTMPAVEEPGPEGVLAPAPAPGISADIETAEITPTPAERTGHTTDPITPARELEIEQTVELSPRTLRLLRYLKRRHMRNVHITKRLPVKDRGLVSEEIDEHEQATIHISLTPTRSLQKNIDTPVPDPITPAPDLGDVATIERAGRQQGLSLQYTEGVARSVYLPHSTLLVDAIRKRRRRKILFRRSSRKQLRIARAVKWKARRRLWITIASTVLAFLIVFLSLGSTAAYITYRFVTSTRRTFEHKLFTLHDLLPPDNLKIYDSKGVLIDQLIDNGIHTSVTFDQVAPIMREVTVATEDKNFWNNQGVDVLGIIRAFLTNLDNGRVVEGGSTITQQLIKNLIVGNQFTIVRKLEEIILAPQVNNNYTKSDILTMYLNSIYYGHQAYGVDAAATVYFGLQDLPGRSAASQLDLAQAAMLAGIPSNPSQFDPLVHFQTATEHFEAVLNLMASQRYISTLDKYEAIREEQAPNFFKTATILQNRAPHFANFVLAQLQKLFNIQNRGDLSRSNMVVYTTLDIDLQDKIQKIAQQHIAELRDAHHLTNAAEVLIDFHTGAVISLLGSIDYNDASIDGQFDVTQAYRQPGSSFKPYVYVTAFEQGASPAEAIDDKATTIPVPDSIPPTFTPSNYDHKFHGHMTLRCALQNSLNVPGVRVLQHVGIDEAMQTAHNMGITSYQGTPGYSLVLGGLGIRLIDHTSAMGVFANGGVRVPYFAINKVVSGSIGKVLYQHQANAGVQVISPQLAYMMTSVLSDNADRIPEFYDCNVLQLYANSQQDCWNENRGVVRPAAAKTGTTNDFRDNWTIGYTTDYVMGVWAGNDDNSPMIDVSGISGAAPIWHDAMLVAEHGHPIQDFVNPGGLVRATVTYPDGVKTTDWFLPGTVPHFDEIPAPTPRIVGNDDDTSTPRRDPGGGNPSGPLPTPYCPGSYSFAFPPPLDNVPPPDPGWW